MLAAVAHCVRREVVELYSEKNMNPRGWGGRAIKYHRWYFVNLVRKFVINVAAEPG